MQDRQPSLRWLVCLSLTLWVAVADAAIVIGNLSQQSAGEVPVAVGSWQASSVEISGDEDWKIKAVTLRLRQSVPNRFLRVCLVGETAFRPDLEKVEVEFATQGFGYTDPDIVTFSPVQSTTATLSPGQRYWLVVGVAAEDVDQSPATGLFLWSYTGGNDPDEGSFQDWQLGAFTASAGTSGSQWEVDVTTPYHFAIDAVPCRAPVLIAAWRAINPGGPVGEIAFLSTDPDGDGWVGLEEFAYDRNRSNELAIRNTPAGIELEFVRWVNSPEISTQLEASIDLVTWIPLPSPAATLLNYDQEKVRLTVDPPESGRFFRLTISKF